jgi:hypothetical protein
MFSELNNLKVIHHKTKVVKHHEMYTSIIVMSKYTIIIISK